MIGGVHVILAFLVLLLLLLKLLRRWLLLRWINVYSRTHGQKQGNNINIQANKSKLSFQGFSAKPRDLYIIKG